MSELYQIIITTSWPLLRSKLFYTCILLFTLVFPLTSLQAQSSKTEATDTLDVFLKVLLERITVTGDPAWVTQIPGAASYIDSEQLKKQGYTDINRVLRNVSGVILQEEDGFGLRPNIGLRGTGSERSAKINLMEDGVLIAPAPYSAPAAYYFPTIARMSSVEVRKGSSQIKYGPNSTGGAINLISTPIPYELSGLVEANVGDYNSHKIYINLGSTFKNYGFLLEGLQIQNDGFKKLDDRSVTGFDITNLMGKFMIRTNSTAPIYQRLELKAGFYDEISNETYLGLTREDFRNTPFRRYAGSQKDQMDSGHVHLMARHFMRFSKRADLTTTLYQNTFNRNWYKLNDVDGTTISAILKDQVRYYDLLEYLKGQTSPEGIFNIRSNKRDYLSVGIESILTLNLGDEHPGQGIELGVRLHMDEEDRFQHDDNYGMTEGLMNLTFAGRPGTQSNSIGSARAISLFMLNKIPVGSWIFTPGIRFEIIRFMYRNYGTGDPGRTSSPSDRSDYSQNILIPGIGITYSIDENLTVISGVHKGFSPPSPGSNTNTRPEESLNYELGLRYNNQLVHGEVIGFFNDYSNLLGSDLEAGGGSGTTARFNAGSVRVFGAEFSGGINLADLFTTSIDLPLNINYTYTQTEFQTSFVSNFGPWGNVEKGDRMPFIPQYQLNAGLSANYLRFGIHLNAHVTGKMRTVAGRGSIPENYSTDGYFLLDASTTYRTTEYMSLYINVRNIFDELYIISDRPAGVRPGLPRTIIGGVRILI